MSQLKVNSIVPSGGLPAGASGGVIQTRYALKSSTFSTSSASFTNITGLSVAIAPRSTSNKVLCIVTLYCGLDGANKRYAWRLTRGGTAIAIADAAGSRTRASGGGATVGAGSGSTWAHTITFLDSPATTSSTTYQVQGAAIDGDNFIVNNTVADADAASYMRPASSIAVMEISG